MKKYSITICVVLGIMAIIFAVVLQSCSKVITPERAASRGARCGQHL